MCRFSFDGLRASSLSWALLASVSLVLGCESPDGSETNQSSSAARDRPTRERPAPSLEWTDPRTLASGPAKMGPWRMNDSTFHYVDDPTVELLPDGRAAVAWVDNQRLDVFFQLYAADGTPTYESPRNVSKSPEIFSWLPKLAVSNDGEHLYVLWQEIVFSGGSHGGEAFVARSTDGGESFEAPVNLSETKDGDGKGRLTSEIWHNGSLDVALHDGRVFATWTAYEGDLWFSHSTDGGESFTEPADVAGTADRPARGPDLAVSQDGTIHLAWTVGQRDDADIRIARSTDGGASFDEPDIPFSTDGHSDAPKITAGPDGGLHLAFGNSPAGMFEHYSVRYAHRPPDGTFPRETVRVSGPQRDGIESANFPHLRVDADGRVYLLWERYPDHEGRPYGLGYAHGIEGDTSLTAPAVVPGSTDRELGINGSLQGMLMQKLDVGAAGRIAVVNSQFDEGNRSRIRLYRGRLESRQ